MKFGSRTLDLSSPKIMGILNITPDSFSDGGRFVSASAAVERVDLDGCLRAAQRMQRDGAHLIDIGGESTRPGAAQVGSQQELDRVLPVLEKLVSELDLVLSVDTSNPKLMSEAAKLGAGLINDVRSLTREGALEAAVQANLPVCLMHMQGDPQTMQDKPCYQSVVDDVSDYFRDRIERCVEGGVLKERIILDPGIGFGKSLEHNRALLLATERFLAMGMPVLVGVSRKSMIGRILDRDDPNDRLAGSLARTCL